MSDCKLDAQLLGDCDLILSKCGRPMAPQGVSYVDIPFGFRYVVANSGNGATVGTREITGPVPWRLRSISMIQSSPAYVRIQLPDGRYASNYLMDFAANALNGSFRKTWTNEISVLPGQKFRILTDTSVTGGGQSQIAMLFEGAYRFTIAGQQKSGGTLDSRISRYFQSPNGNIMAPEWCLDTDFLEVPPGYAGGEFRMSSFNPGNNQPNCLISTPGGQATLQILAGQQYSYWVRRLSFETEFDSGVSGVVSVIPRDSSGYSLTTDYVPVDRLQSLPFARPWIIPAGSSMFFDFQLAQTSGRGNVSINCGAVAMRLKKQQ